jgi:3-phenylpropionate/cinnamic acid dioxygenase small subunit
LQRLASGAAYAQEPPSRLRRLVSNVEVGDAADGADLVTVRSNFLLVELRRHVEDVFAGTAIHTLRIRGGDEFGIVRKVVKLLDNDEPVDNLTFLL